MPYAIRTTRLKKNLGLLNQLYKAKPKLRKAVLECADKDTIHCLCECCYNILNGNIPLSPQHKKALSRYRKDIRFLGSKSGAVKKKQQLLAQKGGLVSAVLAPLLAVAASLLAEWMAK